MGYHCSSPKLFVSRKQIHRHRKANTLRPIFGKQLERWLAYMVRGEKPARKPPAKKRRTPPRDEAYRAWIRSQPCAVCGTHWSVEAAHTGSDGGMRMKASDYSCIPLCVDCHQLAPESYHRIGRRR